VGNQFTKRSQTVVARMAFLSSLLLAGCVTITRPPSNFQTPTGTPVVAEVGFRSQVCAGTFRASLDGNDVTQSFSPQPPTASLPQATFTGLTPFSHTLRASADTLQYWLLFPYCGSGSDSVNFTVTLPDDKVLIRQVVPGVEVGILYDGIDAQGAFNDRSAIVTASAANVATFILPGIPAPANGNSLTVFSRSRQPEVVPALWTANADTIDWAPSNNIRFNVTFWILGGVFSTQQTNAAAAVLAVNNAYVSEKAGLRIAFVTFNDETANPNSAALLAGAGSAGQFQTQIGFTPGEINIYVINTVGGSSNRGANFDGTPVIEFGKDVLTFPQLLEHEIGHAFVLWHTDGEPGFNFENVMTSSVSAHFLTEGQIFRMHFHPSSQLNAQNHRPGLPTFICGIPATNDCPANNRRLWADGALPPN
jgi:hypothetical protein